MSEEGGRGNIIELSPITEGKSGELYVKYGVADISGQVCRSRRSKVSEPVFLPLW